MKHDFFQRQLDESDARRKAHYNDCKMSFQLPSTTQDVVSELGLNHITHVPKY